MINAPKAIGKDLTSALISAEKFFAYSSSNSDQGMRLAMSNQRLSGDNFPSKGSSKFSGEVRGLRDFSRFPCTQATLNSAKSLF